MSSDNDPGGARATWLAELALALDEAQRLTSRLARWRLDSSEAIMLRIRIMAARTEVAALRASAHALAASNEHDPGWFGGIDPMWKETGPRHDQTP